MKATDLTDYSVINCVLANVELYVEPVAVLGSAFIKTSDRGILSM
jgi:hypothetical protein